MDVTKCGSCSNPVAVQNDGTCPACGQSLVATAPGSAASRQAVSVSATPDPVRPDGSRAARGTLKARIDAWLDKPIGTSITEATSDTLDAPAEAEEEQEEEEDAHANRTAADGAAFRFVLSLVVGFLAAKGAGLTVYLLTSALTLDPRGSGLVIAQVLFLAVRAVGGYAGGVVNCRGELIVALCLSVVDVGSMPALSALIGWLGSGPLEVQDALRSASMTQYLLEWAFAVPGYLVGGGLALVQRRYASTRVSHARTPSLAQRVIFRISGFLLCVVGGLICLGAFIIWFKSAGANGPPLFSIDMLLFTLTWTVAGLIGTSTYALGKRLYAGGAAPLTGVPEFVVLRAFRDDAISFQDDNFLSQRFLPSNTKSLEEALVLAAGRHGRVAAIGDPNESLPRPGATRIFFAPTDDTHWRDQALAYIDQCPHILVVLGTGKGVRWEYEQIAARRALNRTILVVPPGGAGSWAEFRDAAAREGIDTLPDELPPATMLCRFDDEGRPRSYSSNKFNIDAYFDRLHQALDDKKAGRNEPGVVEQRTSIRVVTVVGVLFAGLLGAVQGGALGGVALIIFSRWEFEPSPIVGAVAIGLLAIVGSVIGAKKGATIKRFA